jgi:FkbM family methyltransferase
MTTTTKTYENLPLKRKFDKYLLHERQIIGMTKDSFDQNYAERVRRFLMRTIKPNWHTVDLGAGVGYHTLTMAKLAGHVFAYENNLENLSELQKNVSIFQNIRLMPLIVSKLASTTNVDLNASTLIDKRDLKILDKPLILDRQISNCDLIRINTEESLLDVIKGATEIILKHHPMLLIESKPRDLLEVLYILRIEGYKLYRIKPNGRLRKVEGISNYSTIAIFNKN